jgi:hypothetical protein
VSTRFGAVKMLRLPYVATFLKESDSSWYFGGSKVKNFQYFLNATGKTLQNEGKNGTFYAKLVFDKIEFFFVAITQKLMDVNT